MTPGIKVRLLNILHVIMVKLIQGMDLGNLNVQPSRMTPGTSPKLPNMTPGIMLRLLTMTSLQSTVFTISCNQYDPWD